MNRIKDVQKLRGQGPRVFVSYAFGNQLAEDAAWQLSSEGYQVTKVDDSTLLGSPDLDLALEELIQASEVVVPVLCSKAHQSDWVQREIELAKHHGKIIIPLVQDAATLSSLFRRIPYIHESADTLSKNNFNKLRSASFSQFQALPLSSTRPYRFSETELKEFLSRSERPLRLIVDSTNVHGLCENAIPRLITSLTETQLNVRQLVEEQVQRNLSAWKEHEEMLDLYLPSFQRHICNLLEEFGRDQLDRALTPFQRLLQLTIAPEVFNLARTIGIENFCELIGAGYSSIREDSREIERFDNDNSVGGNWFIPWTLNLRARRTNVPTYEKGKWINAEFILDNDQSRTAYLPAIPRFVDALALKDRPSRWMEKWEWADYVIPQFFAQAIRIKKKRVSPDELDPAMERVIQSNTN